MKLVADFDRLKPHLETLTKLKRKRDYFAHHFFREENDKLFSSEATLNLMSRMNVLRKEVRLAEVQVDAVHSSMLQELYPDKDVVGEITADMAERKKQYFENPPNSFGWEDY